MAKYLGEGSWDNNNLGSDLFNLHPLPRMLSSLCIPYTCSSYLLATIIHVLKGSCPYHLCIQKSAKIDLATYLVTELH